MDYWLIKSEPTTYSIDDLKANKKLKGMLVIQRGMRLSVQPVDKTHFDEAVRLGSGKPNDVLKGAG